MSTKKASKESKLSRCIKVPLRILSKARDFYVRSLVLCDAQVSYGSAIGCPTGQVTSLAKSFSVNSSKSGGDEDFRELVRAASTKSLGKKAELDILGRQQSLHQPAASTGANYNMPRSFSAGIGRIDEEKPCEFGEGIKVKTDVYPRSKSYAASKRPGLF